MTQKIHKQVALIVLDGWGYREDTKDNAVAQAHTPNFKKYWDAYPHALLEASGLAVGLPEGQMGNSEVGHMTIGAGKPLDQDLVRIQKSIDTGEYEKNPAFTALFQHVTDNNSVLHALGLVSDGGVHSHQEHLFAFLRAAHKAGIKKVAIHVFTDGRDTAPQSAGEFMKKLETVLDEVGNAFVASISGRFYAMDRDNNWDRLKKTEEALFECKGNVCTIKPSAYLEDLYKQNLGNKSLDEHIEPIVCTDLNGENCAIKDNDAVFFFNFRSDRARMLSEKLIEKESAHNICFATLTEYSAEFKCLVAFPPIKIDTTLAKEISDAGMTQAHIAETEKFPHATYFLNGGFEGEYPGEKHILLDSRKDVQTHDLAPEMRAEAITEKIIEQIKAGTNFIFVNFANPDMVGHTANVPAIVQAVECVDRELGRVVEAMNEVGGAVFFTADHGNAEVNIDPVTGEKHTSHTSNPVPAVLTDATLSLHNGTLADIAPTILTVLGLKTPESMTGKSLLE